MTEPVVILAGGFGTRLRSVVHEKPKVLAPIGRRPFLEILLKNLIEQGARRVILSLHHQADQIVEFVKSTQWPEGVEIQYTIEPQALGTGGALKFVCDEWRIQTPVYVLNGDTFLPSGLTGLRPYADQHANILALYEVPDASRYGSVELGNQGQVTGFHEKKSANSLKPASGLIYSGLAVLDPAKFAGMPLKFSLENDLFSLLVENRQLYGARIQSAFIDIGIPSDYQRFCEVAEGDRWERL